ncbi:YjjG family noncanonical pyrimidine nucleotidase [Phaeocystidibacter marisrubri]|uniref:Noncanonical pyrimidine nucleotidase, YjjG family n=1 Tax=Phaeocystidibacter marisrubri TaxID=1577780 RepID=A0A6L3ZE13_9FLAO|nr:YjjG family noncanonical pyrimidine nucleotidase [Phaeocystidibacter marisrubri]KAB2815687.1 noncanonical pyrimidine nucleotidase, YjjG family [Phaeocystidibacter marisrubri]GGH65185.1 noncanonical pyrimidine nucleotidase, YjjG family protein [Phaeocystidibacter marisrubri]
MRNITHLFFDLDHTLWDFKTNSRETLSDLFHEMRLNEHGVQRVEEFIETYELVNDEKWAMYRSGEIDKETLRTTRFLDSLRRFDVEHPELSHRMEAEYIKRSPHKTHLFPSTLDVLEHLGKSYEMHIITNGFSEVQDIKLEKSGLKPFFKSVITSEEVGVNKPDPKIFLHALKSAGAERKYSVMIGDNLDADIRGARRVGMHQVFFNPDGMQHSDKVSAEIRQLSELLELL